MFIELAIKPGKDKVRRAVMQFAARRGLRVAEPWTYEGLRVETIPDPTEAGNRAEAPNSDSQLGGFGRAIAAMFGDGGAPRIHVDVEISRKDGKTIVAIRSGKHPDGMKMGYALHAYLSDPMAFEPQCPPFCPKCTTPVVNLRSKYCCRCGAELVVGARATRQGDDEDTDGEDSAEASDEEVVVSRKQEGEEPS